MPKIDAVSVQKYGANNFRGLPGRNFADPANPQDAATKNYVDVAVAGAITLSDVYPIGCIYTEITGVNPNTTFGFGTWVAFGAGRVLAGKDSGQTEFDTVEETGGEKTHILTQAELPNINTGGNSADHTHTSINGKLSFVGNTGTNRNITYNSVGGTGNVDGTAPSSTSTGGASASHVHALGGSGSAHNNLQPYIVVHFWKRTA